MNYSHMMKFMLFSSIALPISALAWQQGVASEEAIKCDGLQRADADEVFVRVTPGSDGDDDSYAPPTLAGKREGKLIWEQAFPKAESINAAKFWASCKNHVIEISDQPPGDRGWFTQHYGWDGKKLTFIKRTVHQEQ